MTKFLIRAVAAALFLWPAALFANHTPESLQRVVVLGDSLAAGYGLPAAASFPDQLEQALLERGHAVEVIGAGVSGDTTAGGLARLDWLLADDPDLMIVELGGNDALRGLDPEQTERNLDRILTRLSKAGVRALLTGMRAPRNMGEAYYRQFDRIYPELAAKHDVAFFPFFLEDVAGRPELNLADGIHPNAQGVAVIVDRIVPYLEPLLKEAAAAAAY